MDKIVPAFETTLFDPTLSDACIDMAELGIDSLLDEGVFKSIPIVSVLVGLGKAAQNIQASRVDYLTRQFENFLNNIFKKDMNLKWEWRVSLWGDIFNRLDDIKQLKELVFSGFEGFTPKLLSALVLS